MGKPLYQGKTVRRASGDQVRGRLVTLDGQPFYQIANYDRMRPFFMTVVSHADHWLFIWSNGGLTAGRHNADLALFPYYTDDKIRDTAEITGSKTLLRVQRHDRTFLWEPFSVRGDGIYRVRRNLYKSVWGNQIIFEEINEDLGLAFRYGWAMSQQFGFVRRAWLTNTSGATVAVRLLDGVQNLMPCGADSRFNLEYSTLLDAYKRSELVGNTGLGLFRLSAIPVDRAEPAEALRTTVAWSIGLRRELTLLSATQLDQFRNGGRLRPETDVRGERGAYFLQAKVPLRPGQSACWLIVADVNQGPSEVARLHEQLRRPARLWESVLADVQRGTDELQRLVAFADGLQATGRPLGCVRHYNNVLFNIMRGGVFSDGYKLDTRDLAKFIENANRHLARQHSKFLRRLPKVIGYREMVRAVANLGDPQLERICREYLPLTFSRRHGDPSRPWNRFNIMTRNADGTRSFYYEGNWRDIFQNWEALAVSFPAYVSGMICRFLNASTADGYNPYRITRNGIDWEVVDPHDPWSYIGYWGDHQIIYLLKLLEILDRHEPALLRSLLGREIFAYADVPYLIRPYNQILENPKDTVVFNQHAEELVHTRVRAVGADGKLVWNERGRVRLVNMTEKLLVPVLAKLSNFVPDGGIWLNTQRPEWNDANNALVGNGVSMVTLCHLRRHLAFLIEVFRSQPKEDFSVSEEVAQFLGAVHRILHKHRPLLAGGIGSRERRRVLDALGRAGSRYRQRIYHYGFSGRKEQVRTRKLLDFFSVALEWMDHAIRQNRRTDGLYHAYNLIRLDNRAELPIRRLYEMLEGQVAVLSSGLLSPEESLALLTALRHSAMYRADQHSYMLYPDRNLPRFTEKNNIPAGQLRRSVLLRRLLADGNRQLVERDLAGRVHFNPSVTNARDISRILEELARTRYAHLVKREAPLVLEIFERLFDHESFTGRSGTFFGYEGLGCIYWHMVSKLLLAVQETFFRAVDSGAPTKVLQQLAEAYYDIRAGLGDYKTPAAYGAFPTDPYSHTPGQGGARQPGMTGQVKEDILCRWGELGVFVKDGQISFRPILLRAQEFLRATAIFDYVDAVGAKRQIRLPPGSLAFTYCQVPIIFHRARSDSITVFLSDGRRQRFESLHLDAAVSREIFERTGKVARIEVSLSFRPGRQTIRAGKPDQNESINS